MGMSKILFDVDTENASMSAIVECRFQINSAGETLLTSPSKRDFFRNLLAEQSLITIYQFYVMLI